MDGEEEDMKGKERRELEPMEKFLGTRNLEGGAML